MRRIEEEGKVELPPLGKLPGLTSWELGHLITSSWSSPASAGRHLHVFPEVFSLGDKGMVFSFIPLAKRGDRLVLHVTML